MTLPSSFQFYAHPKARQGQDFPLYSARVDGASLVITWPEGPFGKAGSVTYSLDICQGYFDREEWSIFEVPQPLKAKPFRPIYERLLDIAQDLSYADDENIAAGKFRLYELAGDLERGKAHIKPTPVPTETEQLIAAGALHLYDVTFWPNGKIALHNGSNHSRRITLADVATALKWFDLKAQLDALEATQ